MRKRRQSRYQDFPHLPVLFSRSQVPNVLRRKLENLSLLAAKVFHRAVCCLPSADSVRCHSAPPLLWAGCSIDVAEAAPQLNPSSPPVPRRLSRHAACGVFDRALPTPLSGEILFLGESQASALDDCMPFSSKSLQCCPARTVRTNPCLEISLQLCAKEWPKLVERHVEILG